MKKTISIILCIIMTIALFAGIGISAFAAGGTQTGTCGNNVTYTLKDGVLTISGNGEISESAFIGNWDIKKLIVQEGVTGIAQRAFENCGAMTSVTLADSVRLIASYAFSRCNALREVVMGNNYKLALQDYAIDHCENVHITIKGDIKYPFQSRAFYYSNVTVTVPDTWTEKEMKDYFASSINYIGGWVKTGDLQISQREPGAWEIRGEGAIGDGAFRGRNDFKRVTIDSGITAIGKGAFENCAELTQIEIAPTVTSIGSTAFVGCNKLEKVIGSPRLESIGQEAFKGCAALKEFPFGQALAQMGERAFESSGLVSVKLPGTLKEVPYSAFLLCKNLKTLNIGSGTETLARRAFSNCALTSVTLPDSIREIGSEAFCNNAFSTFAFPASLETVGDAAFDHCKNLKAAIFGDKVRSLGESAFTGCPALKEVRFNEGLETMGRYCFQNSDLQKVVLPSTIKEIGTFCFYGLDDLTSVVIPASVTKLGKGVFAHDTGLKEITCLAPIPPETNAELLYESSSIKKVYVPAMSAAAYQKTKGWSGVEFVGLWDEGDTLTPDSKGVYVLKTDRDLALFLRTVADGNTYSGKTIVLDADIDCSDILHGAMWLNSQRKSTFMGYFNGNGHTISNLTINATDHRAGLFRTAGGGARIENLVLDNVRISAEGKEACGALIGYVNGTVKVSNVTVKSGSVSGGSYVGGLIGQVTGSKLLTVSSCVNNASVSASNKDAAGIVANTGTSAGVKIEKCENTGAIASKAGHSGGIAGYLGNNNDDPAHTVQNCKNSGAVTTEGNGGGIIGGVRSDSTDHVIFGNENTSDVKAGGSESYAGGIIGFLEGGGLVGSNTNSGNIVSLGREAGGIVAAIEDDSTEFDSDENSGSVSAKLRAGGIVGYAGNSDHDKTYQFTNCKNSGAVTSETSDAGGIVGGLCTDSRKHTVCGNKNSGEINGVKSVGGIIGWMKGGGNISDNTNTGDVTASGTDGKAGGIVGHVEDDPCTFDGCSSTATIRGSKNATICGWDGYKDAPVGESGNLISSVFSGGSLWIIIGCACLLIALGALMLIRKKKSPKAESGEANK